uniref:Transmembrane protein 116 n=2 Tax=Nothobranchius rachovii TaxID=451742 RepID=A0A1A8NBI6_9TELE
MPGQFHQTLQVSADAHWSAVPDLRSADQPILQSVAHLPDHSLPQHLPPDSPQHQCDGGKSSPYLQAGCVSTWLPWQRAADFVPSDGPTDGPVPAGVCPLLGSSRDSGAAASVPTLDASWSGDRRPLHTSGSHRGLSGLPQLSGLRMDLCSPASSQSHVFFTRRGHPNTSAAVPAGQRLPELEVCGLNSGERHQLSLSVERKPP